MLNFQAERRGFICSVSVQDTKHCCPGLSRTLLASVRCHRHAILACIKGHVPIMAQHKVRISDTANFCARKRSLPGREMTPGAFEKFRHEAWYLVSAPLPESRVPTSAAQTTRSFVSKAEGERSLVRLVRNARSCASSSVGGGTPDKRYSGTRTWWRRR